MGSVLNWFDDSGNAALAAVAVSLVSVVVSAVALRKSSTTQRRLLEIEEQREQDRIGEREKASLVARITREPSASGRTPNYHLEIENLGQASARDIRILLDELPHSEHPTMVGNQPQIKHVGPQSSSRYLLAPTLSTRPPATITITWADDSGEAGTYSTTLT